MVGTQHVTKDCQWSGSISNNRLPTIQTLCTISAYHWSGPYMQHEVTNGRDPIFNINLPMVGTLYAT